MPDPDALNIDAMSLSLSIRKINLHLYLNLYLFPPFSMIWPVVNKIPSESTKDLVIAPMWPTQSWFNKFLELGVEQPMIMESKYL